jgi:hypothetical protein
MFLKILWPIFAVTTALVSPVHRHLLTVRFLNVTLRIGAQLILLLVEPQITLLRPSM